MSFSRFSDGSFQLFSEHRNGQESYIFGYHAAGIVFDTLFINLSTFFWSERHLDKYADSRLCFLHRFHPYDVALL
jgi:hypothetical protein